MGRIFFKLAKWTSILVAAGAVVFLAVRVYDSQRGPPLEIWHTYVPHEMHEAELDAATWEQYLAREAKIFDELRVEVTQKVNPADRVALNRYSEASPVYPGHFKQDFNRSFVLEPKGTPVGAAVLLHGLTDAPYSQRHIAEFYRQHGFVAIVIRLPGHGTVPAGLTDATWQDWAAATRLAVREARRRVGPSAPLHLVGFSNGGALSVNYALDALADPKLPQVDRIVLISPMIGITRFARFAGLAALPAMLPAFSKAAWLGILPEFNPFKYNSFPVNGAVQSFELTQVLQNKIRQAARSGQIEHMPPIITFQSVMDFTVSTPAIIDGLYAYLPNNGSEIVLYDVNRTVKLEALMRPSAERALSRLLPNGVRNYRTTIITNEGSANGEEFARTVEAGETASHDHPLGLSYPPGLYSLSHVAIPFPMTDSLYGLTPDPEEDFGLHLGALAPRGERNVLIASLDALLRASSNPFYPYMVERIGEGIAHPAAAAGPRGALAPVAAAAPDNGKDEFSGLAVRDSIAEISRFIRGEPIPLDEAP